MNSVTLPTEEELQHILVNTDKVEEVVTRTLRYASMVRCPILPTTYFFQNDFSKQLLRQLELFQPNHGEVDYEEVFPLLEDMLLHEKRLEIRLPRRNV